MILCKYRRDDGSDVLRMEWFPRDAVPAEITDTGGRWLYEPPIPRDTTQAVAPADSRFVSYQLPKWYPHAKKHDEKGRCIFTSQQEAIDCAKRATDAGEAIGWDR